MKIQKRDFVSKAVLAKATQTDDELWAELGALFEALDLAGQDFWDGVEERGHEIEDNLKAFFKENRDLIKEVGKLHKAVKHELHELRHIHKVVVEVRKVVTGGEEEIEEEIEEVETIEASGSDGGKKKSPPPPMSFLKH